MNSNRDHVAQFRLDHVQLAMPAGEEEAARAFYAGVLGFEEMAKPAELAISDVTTCISPERNVLAQE